MKGLKEESFTNSSISHTKTLFRMLQNYPLLLYLLVKTLQVNSHILKLEIKNRQMCTSNSPVGTKFKLSNFNFNKWNILLREEEKKCTLQLPF